MVLLTTALRNRICEPNIDLGFERFSALVSGSVDYASFCDAVTTCLAQGLIHEPIRLPDGSLQCHWHLRLTAAGADAARRA